MNRKYSDLIAQLLDLMMYKRFIFRDFSAIVVLFDYKCQMRQIFSSIGTDQ